MRSRRQVPAIVLSLALVAACGGEPFDPRGESELEGEKPDTPAEREEQQATPQSFSAPALPGPGELCPDALCSDEAVCLGGVCHRKCTQALPSCNDVVRGCTAEEVCLPATSFTDACFPATARTGEPCGSEADGAICRAGNLCVQGLDGHARCLKLCRYSCPAAQCVQTTSGCDVCVP